MKHDYNQRTINKLFSEGHKQEHWGIIFNKFKSKKLRILDFGCGGGYGIKFGRELGYQMFGLETTELRTFDDLREHRKKLGVEKYVKLYNGFEPIPFEDDSFDIIACRASFNKFNQIKKQNAGESLVVNRLCEFDRILSERKIVIITGKYYREQFKQFNFTVLNWSKNGIRRLRSHEGK